MVRAASLSGLLLGAAAGAYAACVPRPECDGVNAISTNCASREAPYFRDTFWVGGRDVASNATGTTYTSAYDQLYVGKLLPLSPLAGAAPTVSFHGGGISGATWLNTPDNRRGWASFFIKQGYTVYIIDATSVGRTTSNDLATFDSTATPMRAASTAETIQEFFSAPQNYNDYPQAALHTQFPGTGMLGDKYFDQFRRTFLPLSASLAGAETAMRASGCELLKLIGTKSYLISHSLGARVPLLLSNDCPQYIAGNIALEAATTPFVSYNTGLGHYTASPWGFTLTSRDYDPPVFNASELVNVTVGNETIVHRDCVLQAEPARQLPNIASVPFLMLTSEASVHVTYDHCTIDYLKQTGGNPEWIKLADIDIH